MSEVQVDRGAIRFVLGGAHIMCPGLTSPGGKMEEEVEAEMPVVSSTSIVCVHALFYECSLLIYTHIHT
jgi:predicted RNA-binding protein (TIGR00451 family)